MPVEFLKYTPGKTLKVRVTSPTRVRGQHLDEGSVVEMPESEAYELIIAQKAVRYVESARSK